MAAALGSGEDQEDGGQLVFQRGKKLNDDYYIISVRDSAENACVSFSAYELETSETFDVSYSYADFDGLFKTHPELVNPPNKEGRYDWVIDRLDLTSEHGGKAKRLLLLSDPTTEDEGPVAKPAPAPKVIPKGRLTYAERMRLKQEAEKLEEKRASNIALKSEKNRRAFVAELSEKRKLEELKLASRKQRIDEERAERREKAEMQKHISEERQKRYDENDRKRGARIADLELERKARDLTTIRSIIDSANQKKEALEKRLEDARNRKKDEEATLQSEMLAKKEAEQQVEAKRDQKMGERNERVKEAEREYLEFRKRTIEQIAQEKRDKAAKKEEYLKEKCKQRAAQLREKHNKIDAWEQLDDVRMQNNLKKEHARNVLMVEHIDNLRQEFMQQQSEASARKQAALQQRKEREAKDAETLAEENRKRAEVEKKRQEKIAEREAAQTERNQKYCQEIRDVKSKEAARMTEQREHVDLAKHRIREEQIKERQFRSAQDEAAAVVNAVREENIGKRDHERDLRFAQKVKERKEADERRQMELQTAKIQRRLQEKEAAERHQEDELQKRRQMNALDEKREEKMREKAAERNRREQERMKNLTAKGGPSGGAEDHALKDSRALSPGAGGQAAAPDAAPAAATLRPDEEQVAAATA
mmetsp:Transcript_46414/g.131255  ORF Transcript_46414/g.131255 Transcript_46414/m.131255 type:complete len:649 (-) Transcript_46414:17-1963(-)